MTDDLCIPDRANVCSSESGIDSRAECFDIAHFENYPWPVEYCYNTRGFRDREWPQDLQHAVWCLGDSFTVGIGQPESHTWPRVLEQRLARPTINISLDGASNDWISRRAQQIINHIAPQIMVIQWSFVGRRENPQQHSDTARRIRAVKSTPEQDLENFCKNLLLVQESAADTCVIHTTVPAPWPGTSSYEVSGWWWNDRQPGWPDTLPSSWQHIPDAAKLALEQKDPFRFQEYRGHFEMLDFVRQHQIIITEPVDLARDGFHYDVVTARHLVDRIMTQL